MAEGKKISENAMQAFRDDPDFAAAYKEVSGLSKDPTTKDMLRLYGLSKVGQNEDFPGRAKLSLWERVDITSSKVRDAAKRDAWGDVLEKEELTPEQARREYINLVEKLKESYGLDQSKVKEIEGLD